MLLNIIGWIIWAIAAIMSIMYLLNNNRDGGVRYMMRTQGIVLVIGLVVTFSLLSKFHLIWIFVLSYFIPMMLMQRKVGKVMKNFEHQLKEHKETGKPLSEILNRDSK